MEIRRIRLAYNNVYAVESAGVRVLVDTGPDYAGARATLAEALNTPEAVALRRAIRQGARAECARCVCALQRGPRQLLLSGV